MTLSLGVRNGSVLLAVVILVIAVVVTALSMVTDSELDRYESIALRDIQEVTNLLDLQAEIVRGRVEQEYESTGLDASHLKNALSNHVRVSSLVRAFHLKVSDREPEVVGPIVLDSYPYGQLDQRKYFITCNDLCVMVVPVSLTDRITVLMELDLAVMINYINESTRRETVLVLRVEHQERSSGYMSVKMIGADSNVSLMAQIRDALEVSRPKLWELQSHSEFGQHILSRAPLETDSKTSIPFIVITRWLLDDQPSIYPLLGLSVCLCAIVGLCALRDYIFRKRLSNEIETLTRAIDLATPVTPSPHVEPSLFAPLRAAVNASSCQLASLKQDIENFHGKAGSVGVFDSVSGVLGAATYAYIFNRELHYAHRYQIGFSVIRYILSVPVVGHSPFLDNAVRTFVSQVSVTVRKEDYVFVSQPTDAFDCGNCSSVAITVMCRASPHSEDLRSTAKRVASTIDLILAPLVVEPSHSLNAGGAIFVVDHDVASLGIEPTNIAAILDADIFRSWASSWPRHANVVDGQTLRDVSKLFSVRDGK